MAKEFFDNGRLYVTSRAVGWHQGWHERFSKDNTKPPEIPITDIVSTSAGRYRRQMGLRHLLAAALVMTLLHTGHRITAHPAFAPIGYFLLGQGALITVLFGVRWLFPPRYGLQISRGDGPDLQIGFAKLKEALQVEQAIKAAIQWRVELETGAIREIQANQFRQPPLQIYPTEPPP